MRAVRDTKLPEPFRSWIVRTTPLPPHVRLLPRTVSISTDLLTLLSATVSFGGMGGILLAMLWKSAADGADGPEILVFGGAGLLLWVVPLLLLRRLWITFLAQRDQTRGTLRQGVFIGPEGILVRMQPNRCHPVAADHFVMARCSNSGSEPTLIIETRDGTVEFSAERLAGESDEINDAARKLWPGWKKPQPIERPDRKRRKDTQSPRGMMKAAGFFAVSMLTLLAGFIGVTAIGGDSAFSIVVLAGLLLVLGSAVNLGYWFLKFQLSYSCPTCRKKCSPVESALPAIHYYCAACNTEWETGVEKSAGGD